MRKFILIAGVILFVGCTKTKITEEKFGENKSQDFVIKPSLGNRSAAESTNVTDLRSFFLTYDTNILRVLRKGIDPAPDMLSSTNGPGVQYMIAKNTELIGNLSSIRSSVYYGMNPDDDMAVYAGIIEMVIQLEGGQGNIRISKPFPWSCIRGVLEGLLTGAGIVESYQALIASGGTWTTVRSFLWTSLKRYAGWWAAAGAIYDIVTECF